MRTSLLAAWSSLAIAVGLSAQTPTGPRAGVDWPGFRGIEARGVDEQATPPLQWSVPASKLVRWRVPVAGLAHSSPVVWGNHVCTATAVSGTARPSSRSASTATSSRCRHHRRTLDGALLRQERPARSSGSGRRTTGVPKVKRHPSRRTPTRRWRPTAAHRRVLRLRGALRLRHGGQSCSGRRTSACSTRASSWRPTRSGASPARR